MNEVLKAIAERRSIRGYEDKQISAEELNALVKVALESPSARNAQPWHFSFVQDKALIDAVDKEILKNAGREGTIFYGAPLVIFISADASNSFAGVDSGIATQNIALAAHSMGLGSVILGMPRFAFEGEKGAEFEKALKFPQGHKFQIALSVGYPTMGKDAHEIFDGKVDIIA